MLPSPLAERVLYAAFVAGGRTVATRAQLTRVCRCALSGSFYAVGPSHRPASSGSIVLCIELQVHMFIATPETAGCLTSEACLALAAWCASLAPCIVEYRTLAHAISF